MLEFDASEPGYLGKLDVGGASTLEALRLSLESNNLLEWTFDFWDVIDRRHVRKKLEWLKGFLREVQVIRAADKAVGDDNKQRCLLDGSVTLTTAEHAVPLEEAVQFVEVKGEDLVAPSVGSSRLSGSTNSDEVDNNPVQSTLFPTAITDRYLERAKKLRSHTPL